MPAINWLSVILAALVPMVVGFVWYHEKVFGTAWMTATGMTKEKARKSNMAMVFGLTFVMAFLLSMFVLTNVDGPGQEGQYDTFRHGAVHGMIMAFLVVMPLTVINGLFEMRSAKLMFITIGYWAVTLILMGGVLDAMNHDPFPAVM